MPGRGYGAANNSFYTEMAPEMSAMAVKLRLAGIHRNWCVYWALLVYKDEADRQKTLESLENYGWYKLPQNAHHARDWLPEELVKKYLDE